MEQLLTILLFILIAVVAIASQIWRTKKSEDLLKNWAMENGFRIINLERRHLLQGPFFLTSSKGQTIYYVSIVDKSGKTRSAWIRCGGWFTGLFSDSLKVKWEDEG